MQQRHAYHSILTGTCCAVQLLREAASRGGHMAHAAGTSPPPPTAPLGASGAETIKEFEVGWATGSRQCLLTQNLFTGFILTQAQA